MIVGICMVTLHLPGVGSLKAKRSIVKSLTARLHREFNVSCAEVDHHDIWKSTVLGIAIVSTGAGHAQGVLENTVRWIEVNRPDVMVVEHSIEIIH
jgi:uncharacterized protein YlxP (DUF503 family)